jgi:UDP-N-acetylmuramate--alanine ligase
MLIWTLKQLKIPVSYSIGTTISFGPSGQFNPDSQYFIYECDEFDRNFLHFKPYLSLVSSIGYDHFDTYPTEQAYLEAFRQFAKQSHQVIAWKDQHQEIFRDLTQVNLLEPATIDDSLLLAGHHNRRNATLVKTALEWLSFSGNLSGILVQFPGTSRRFEELADNLYTDYAHHPTEIAATIQLARELSDHVVVVYQPHQNIRQFKLQSQYSDCFNGAEVLYWLPTYLTREDPSLPVLTPEQLTANLIADIEVHLAELDDNLWHVIQTARKSSKLVLCLGAGTIDSWLREKLTLNS